jgi:hypothetical protein
VVGGHALNCGLSGWRRDKTSHEISDLLFCTLVSMRSHKLFGKVRTIILSSQLSAFTKRFHVSSILKVFVGVTWRMGGQRKVELRFLVEMVLDDV